jgi:nitroimidazol reductase NimA-like FMN-containing flavoprotein (pyridoxamine 5'-phosphate oxidase superfamily)
MSDTSHDHEIVSIYGMSDEQIDQLMTEASECVLMWSTSDGWPVGVTHAFVWKDQRVWLTFAAHRHRAAAIRRDNRVSVAVSGVVAKTVAGAATMKGIATFHDDDETKQWFYRALARKVRPDSREGEEAFYRLLDSPLRVILEIEPVKWITYDANKAGLDMQGRLPDDQKTPRQEADAVRMNRERQKRGLPPR